LAPLAATGRLIRARQLRLGRDPRRHGFVYDPSVLKELVRRWRHILPWIVSGALLAYVFGWATDWQRLWAAIEHANVPIFVALAAADRLGFFVVWTWFQAEAIRRFVVPVPYRSVVAIRGGSELLRAVSNPLSDAAFFLGLVQLAGGRLTAVISAIMLPVAIHALVMLLQMTVALPFVEGPISENRSVLVTILVLWVVVAGFGVALRLSVTRPVRLPGVTRVRAWLVRFRARDVRLFFLGFVSLSVFDVVVQGLASRAFGVSIGWGELAARIPLVYFSFVIPTLGNFGTRELAWAALFSEFGTRDALIAYAFAVNAIFLLINVLLGVVFLSRGLALVAGMRRAQQEGEPVPQPPLHDPTDI